MNSYLEVLLFRLYYKIPFFSYQQKRKIILSLHRHLKIFTKNTVSYKIHKMTTPKIDGDSQKNYSGDYSKWIKKYDYLLPLEYEQLRQSVESHSSKPLISIFMAVCNIEDHWLHATIESVIRQSYSHWQLYVVANIIIQPHTLEILDEYARREPRIKLALKDTNDDNSIDFNIALKNIAGDFITLLNIKDLLAPHALLWVALDIISHPKGMLWYSDEDKIDKNGERSDPFFKPDWNPDFFLSYPYNLASHLGVYRTSLVRQLNGFQQGYQDAQEYDLALRAIEQISPSQIHHIPRILYHCYKITDSIPNHNTNIPISLPAAALDAVNDYLNRKQIKAEAIPSPDNLYIRVRYQLPRRLPLITLIIPTRNGFQILSRCIESIIKKTNYPNYEIIIVNNESDDPKTIDYLRDLSKLETIKVLDYPYIFNYSAINNMAINHAQGELVGFLNNDIEVINHDWLTEMISHALRPEIGAVGARLWYKNNTLQHGGVVLGISGVANHSHKGLAKGDIGYFGRAVLIQNFSAVTGACLVLRKNCFKAVGGFNEEQLAVSFNDVDLCLKLIKLGLRITWTPYAELYHYESASRGYDNTVKKLMRSQKEMAYMQEQWGDWLMLDPAYNPNLTLETENFALAWPPRIKRSPINHIHNEP